MCNDNIINAIIDSIRNNIDETGRVDLEKVWDTVVVPTFGDTFEGETALERAATILEIEGGWHYDCHGDMYNTAVAEAYDAERAAYEEETHAAALELAEIAATNGPAR